ncbi:MAG TPA: sigma-54 dependent transcriptional regulator [bacterium]|nr:sigma-54 dependent transcriptional regulator [bacterium]HMW35313.1 sigma-54 dependent transcriptional regulator [bacterium]HMZ04754.1 sigma-54 dependent transcriptional regulator [bacterium]HNB08349.1 sigma-54 dependent transcriptional regulator [bacterium]HND77087.1 sigma-54 dependent transcriptional regulator [bacterium]
MSPSKSLRILVIEDNATMREGIVDALMLHGLNAEAVSGGKEGLERMNRYPADLVITDYKMSPVDGMSVLKQVASQFPDTEVMMITAFGTVDVAVEAMKSGASDFITKPFSPDELIVKVDKILDGIVRRKHYEKTSEEVAYLRTEIDRVYNFSEIIGDAPSMHGIFEIIRRSADSSSAVAIYGESGTGKELIARAIHYNSQRRDKPFIKVNCAALTETLLESELFGHEKGAFTGAIKTKRGRFELADTGTLFLDEIGEISMNMQVKLLRAIQEQEFERVGGEDTLRVDVRIIAATNRNLQELIQRGVFREDLYYRLHVLPIVVPPLRERKGDIPRLVDHVIRRVSENLGLANVSVEPGVYAALSSYDWPGNVRELENVIERAIVLSADRKLTAESFLGLTGKSAPFPIAYDDVEKSGLDEALASYEKTMIIQALNKAEGSKTEAARLLGVKTSAFYYKLEKYGLH